MIKAIIIDDEQNARENLLHKINSIDPSIEVIGQAEDVDTAFDLINDLKPNVIFLDIEMPEKDGFELIEMFDKIDFQVVFVTAFNEYAIKAFQNFAFNYILKPIDNDILESVLMKLQKILSNVSPSSDIKALLSYINGTPTHSKLGIPTESGIDMVNIDDVISLEASEGYTIIKLLGERKIISSKRFQYFEDRLLQSSFIKIHRSFFVNINHIDSYHKVGFIKLQNGDELPVSKSMRNHVISTLRCGKLSHE